MKLYHCTSSSYAKAICENGIIPNYSYEMDNKVVFLSDIPRHEFGCICFEIDATKLNILRTKNLWEYVYFNHIPNSCIKFYSYEEDE